MLFSEIPKGSIREKIKQTFERAKEIGDCDIFTEFKKDFPEITIMLREFEPLFLDMLKKGEIKL